MAFELPKQEAKPKSIGIFKTGPFHLNPLFEVEIKKGYKLIVSSWEEAFGLFGTPKIQDVDEEYIANFLFNNFEYESSPYKRIKRLPRNSIISYGQKN